MIISASYKTDIPTFYGTWFMNRLEAGYCVVVNPYNQQPFKVNLDPESVQGIVFWTKNLAPFYPRLSEVRDRGYTFVIQHSINNYPRALETSVVDAVRSVEQMEKVAETFGGKVGVWRYDPIVFSSLTPMDFHVQNFMRLAAMLEGMTDEVVVSFAQIYQKTKRNLETAAKSAGFTWDDPSDEIKHALLAEFLEVACLRGMRLSVCSQKAYLRPGIGEARCVDAERFASITGRQLKTKLKGNRPECGCYESRDIGDYDTCPHGCVYCYAVQNRELAQTRFKEHDPEGESLFPIKATVPPGGNPKRQLSLF